MKKNNGQREIRIMNMRNLDNQMMLYFSDKSLIFKLYYYILLKRKQNEQGKNVETSYYTREIHTPSLNHKQI